MPVDLSCKFYFGYRQNLVDELIVHCLFDMITLVTVSEFLCILGC